MRTHISAVQQLPKSQVRDRHPLHAPQVSSLTGAGNNMASLGQNGKPRSYDDGIDKVCYGGYNHI